MRNPPVLDVVDRQPMTDTEFLSFLMLEPPESHIVTAGRRAIGESVRISPTLLHPNDRTCEISPLFRWHRGKLSSFFDLFRGDFDALSFQIKLESLLESECNLRIVNPTIGENFPKFSCLTKGHFGWTVAKGVDPELTLGQWLSNLAVLITCDSQGLEPIP
mgnify:CR=1 FL=1